jgi:hypothetical protein
LQAQLLTDDACHLIDRATGREGGDQFDGLRGPLLRRHDGRECDGERQHKRRKCDD